MAIINGTLILSEKENVTAKMLTYNTVDVANTFRLLQGYTAAPDGSNLFAMLKSSKPGNNPTARYENARLVKTTDWTTQISNNITNLNHANDCTFYDNKFFVVTFKVGDKNVYVFDMNSLNQIGVYTYNGNQETLTCISYVSGNLFLLGNGCYIDVCELSGTSFHVKSSFTLDGDVNDTDIIKKLGADRQGMFYGTTARLFRAYSKRNDDGSIRKNYVAKWTLTGTFPNITGSTLKGIYEYSAPSNTRIFEMEDISASKNQMYAAVSTQTKKEDEYEAKLYYLTLLDS